VTDNDRPNPDALLSSVQREEAARKRGRLKVFLGMCPGVGKTFAMLEAARRELAGGRDIVIGYVETHGRKETDALTVGLPQLSRRQLEHRGITLTEFDLDATLSRHPQLVLVDELAHTNVPGSRHPKRWQDVQELLDAGIDVLTTLNVQHVESLADTVHQVTGAEIRETVPDSVLDDAVVELVDLPPAELVQRLHEGKVYLPDRAATAAQNFFREANLTALRELALRLTADHVGADTRGFRNALTNPRAWKTGHCLLVAVGPGPYSEPLIRWTRRMADGLKCRWLAVHVEDPRPLSDVAQAQLEKNLSAARELGAQVVSTTDDDLVRGLLRVAREQNATQIVLGKPVTGGWRRWFPGDSLLRRLTRESGDIDLQIVRADKADAPENSWTWQQKFKPDLKQYLWAVGLVGIAALVNLGLLKVTGPRVPGMVFLVTVVLMALKVGRGPVLVAGTLSALVWDFFFLPPRFTFNIVYAEDAVLFGAYFVVALVLGQLVARIRAQEQAERLRETRAIALYELTRELAEASSRDEVVWQLIAGVSRVFRASAAICLAVNDKLTAHPDGTFELNEKELSVGDWAFRNRKAAGRFTDNLPGATGLHLPLATERKVFGILAVNFPEKRLTLSQLDLLETFARQASLVLDRIELRTAAEQARLLSESERLSRALLNSISHELRTPLAASTSAASALANTDQSSGELRTVLVQEIQEANARLNRIVSNLLDVARLESGKVLPRLDWHDARDVVQTTLRELKRDVGSRPIKLLLPSTPLLARIDFSLTQHALANLLLNAVMHTPSGTPIQVQARMDDGSLTFQVADEGPGIPADVLPRIFDKFFRSPNAPAGGSGLGLTIAKGFVEAQGGKIQAATRPSGGAIFSLLLPQTEQPPAVEPG
jgi:two-component system sensor histidine kinase KdpD